MITKLNKDSLLQDKDITISCRISKWLSAQLLTALMKDKISKSKFMRQALLNELERKKGGGNFCEK